MHCFDSFYNEGSDVFDGPKELNKVPIFARESEGFSLPGRLYEAMVVPNRKTDSCVIPKRKTYMNRP